MSITPNVIRVLLCSRPYRAFANGLAISSPLAFNLSPRVPAIGLVLGASSPSKKTQKKSDFPCKIQKNVVILHRNADTKVLQTYFIKSVCFI